MSNMGYCRFQNTLRDLLDCEAHLYDVFDIGDNNDHDEQRARRRLVALCQAIAGAVEDNPLPGDE